MAGFLPGGIGYGRPAGIPDNGGGGPIGGGLFNQGMVSPTLGILGAALADAGASFSGRPEAAVNLQRFGAQLRSQQQQEQLMQGLTSQDPAQRQQAYAFAALNGIDTKPFQQQQAAQALPQLLKSMQPTQDTVSAIPAPLPMGPQFAPQTAEYQKPGLSPMDALSQINNPELQSQLAPKFLEQQMEMQAKAVRPATAEEKRAAGLSDKTPAQVNAYGQISPISDPNQITPYQQAELDNAKAGRGIQWAQFNETKRHDQAVEDAAAHPFGKSVGNETGDAFLAQVAKENPGLANQVKAIATYRQAPPGRGTKQGIALLSLVNQYEPGYDATQYNTKQKARNDYGTGVQGKSVVAINNAMAHLDLLGKLADAMGNGDVQALNAAKQAYEQQFGSPAPTTFDAVRNIAAQEVVKSVVPGGGGVAERAAAAEDFKKSASPQQMHGAINGVRGLFAGQLHNSKRQYEKLTGLKDFNDFLSPETIGLMSMPIERAVGVAGPNSLPRLPGNSAGWTVKRR